jgi:hypothetical protein
METSINSRSPPRAVLSAVSTSAEGPAPERNEEQQSEGCLRGKTILEQPGT